jgi:hypothetical protein
VCGGEPEGKGLRKKDSASHEFANSTQSLRQTKNLTWPALVLSTRCLL